MKLLAILILIISGFIFTSCSGSAEKKETPRPTNTSVTNTMVVPQSDATNVANTSVKSEDKDADDVRPTNSANSNNSVKKDDMKSKDVDDIRKSNSNIKSKDKDDLNKKGDADDKGKRDSDGDDDDN
jgi:hypothetical protein